ncbi:NINE protein [Lactiplantibacillus plantarum]|nr:NINE protein [Lactiplantibacillus plantarum]
MNSIYMKSKLSNQELLLVNSEIEKNSKSTLVAYLLWLFTGFMGGHRYYFGKTGSAVAMTLIFWLTVWIFGLGYIITGIWMLVDVFQISSWLKADQKEKEQAAIQEILMRRDLKNSSEDHSSLHDDSVVEDVPDSEVSSEESK